MSSFSLRAASDRVFMPFFITLVVMCGTVAADTSLYVRGADWPETMVATRAAYQAWREERMGGGEIVFGPWFVAGPFEAERFDTVLFPEEAVEIHARDDANRRIWHRRNDLTDGVPHALSCGDRAAVYLTRVITVPEPVSLNVGLGSDDGIAVWLNDALVLSNDVARVVAPDQEQAALDLEAGDNRLLLKIYNITGGCGFYFAPLDDPAEALWRQVKQDFPREAAMLETDLRSSSPLDWFRQADITELQRTLIRRAATRTPETGERMLRELEGLDGVPAFSPRWLDLYLLASEFHSQLAALDRVNFRALRMAIEDLTASFPGQYPGAGYLERLDAYEGRVTEIRQGLAESAAWAAEAAEAVITFEREVLTANPLLDFDALLLVRRNAERLGLPQNWQGNCSLPRGGYDNEIALLSPLEPEGAVSTLYRPEDNVFVGDLDLYFEGDRLLFSMPGSHGRWQIWEINTDGTGLRQVTPGIEPDVDNYDACYLPDGNIIFDSTRVFQGIPCVAGGDAVANLYRMDHDGSNIRRLVFDQDHSWCPTILNNGRVMFTRWEYSDTAHYFTRLLFHMNPDGTNQMEYYGSNSFWPNSIFYARAIPDHPTKVVAIVSGHHGVPRMGELIIFDPARGRHEADGVVQRIPGYGETVAPIIEDYLVDNSWPKFLHPWPLSERYFIVSCKPDPDAHWGIYLVDVFDNMLLLHEEPGYALFEAVPLRPRTRPPVVPSRINLDKDTADVYMMDVYQGPGLEGVPRGTVKELRLFAFHYAYNNMGGHEHIGVEGPWDARRMLGVVPVLEDGSAYFRVPANKPIAVQPLDEQGRALQVMRSWFTAMPGEVLSCVGCHESQNMTPVLNAPLASRRAPDDITPWYGEARGFSFIHEVQPVLDRYCVGCHNPETSAEDERPDFSEHERRGRGNFNRSYLALHPYVRRPGPESDYHLQIPLEWHADTSELIQMLRKGHQGVQLSREAWDRLVTWIDLNVPDHGRWSDHAPIPNNFDKRRAEMSLLYSNNFIDNTEAELTRADYPREFIMPEPPDLGMTPPAVDGWPFDAEAARERQAAAGAEKRRTIELAEGVFMNLVLIPAGAFVMGGNMYADELPLTGVHIEKPFWLGEVEVTNRQYNVFDPDHDSRYFNQHHKDHTTPGYPANRPEQPVIRISWQQAMAFCDWLAEKTGEAVTLPTEAQWEWACRAGSDDKFFYGGLDTDFSAYANLADYSMRLHAVSGVDPQPIPNPTPFQNFLPQDPRFDDGQMVSADTGLYQPNAWGLKDMHGNVAEWTRSLWRPYPYVASDGRNDRDADGKRVVRGGSWRDRPKHARAAYRLPYQPWQGVFNVGFRIMIPYESGRTPVQMAAE